MRILSWAFADTKRLFHIAHQMIGDWILLVDFKPFYRVEDFCDFVFPAYTAPSEKGVSIERKEL